MTDIFIAYSHEDIAFKNDLKKFLRPMLREEKISIWDDFDIEAGEEWDAKIKERLYGAGVILLLVSADSLASDYFYGKEVKVSLERHARGEAVVVPVILRHCDWENTPLGGLEVLPSKGRPVVEWPSTDQAWNDVVSRLRRVVDNIEQRRKKESALDEQKRRYQAAIDAAEHLFSQQKWAEARFSYSNAMQMYLAGFMPDKSYLKQQISVCERAITAEAERQRQAEAERKSALAAENRRIQEAKRQQREDEIRRQKAEKEDEKQRTQLEKKNAGNNAFGFRYLLLLLLGSFIVFIALWLILTPGPHDLSQFMQSEPQETTDQSEASAYQNALNARTIPALKEYLEHHSNSKNSTAARDTLKNLLTFYNNKLSDATLFQNEEDRSTACDYLNEALAVSPGDSVILKMKKALKCP